MAVWNGISGSRCLDGDSVFGGDGHELSHFRHAGSGRGIKFCKHLIKAATRRAKDEHASRLVADIADGTAPATCAEEEAAGRNAMGRRVALEFDNEFAAQHIEGFILTTMGVRRYSRARRNPDSQSEKDPAVSAPVAL
nr:hypothetical protein [Mesorhizobium onobrychidis]